MIRIKRFLYKLLDFFRFTPFRALLFISVILFSSNVYASDYNVTNKIKSSTSGSSGTYQGLEIYNSGSNNIYSTGTRYNGQLSRIVFYLNSDDWDWNYNSTYTITLSMATQDWRNHFMGPQVFYAQSNGNLNSGASNLYVSNSFQFISMYKIKFSFKIGSTMAPYLYFNIYSSNVSSTSFTGVTNWNLSTIVISDNSSSGSSSTPTPVPTSTPAPSGATNQDIINNQNSNTNSIINNQNSNTQSIIDSSTSNTTDIIDNANSNTQQIIDNNNSNFNDCFKSFSNSILSSGKGYNLSGQLVSRTGSLYSNVYKIEPTSTITITDGVNNTSNVYILWDENMNFIDYYYMRTRTSRVPSNARYFAFSKVDSGINVSIDTGFCTSKFDSMTQSIDNVNDTMKDDNIDDKTGFFTDFQNNDHGLTSIITLPLSTIQQLTNTSCVSLSVPIPFTDSNVTLPCMTQVYETYIPSVYNIWQVVSFGIISYFICLDIFKIVKGLKDPNEDKVEVLDL